MASKPQNMAQIGRSNRAGISSARARRLAEKIDDRKPSSGKWLYAVSGIAVVGALAVAYNSSAFSALIAGSTEDGRMALVAGDAPETTAAPKPVDMQIAREPAPISPQDVPALRVAADPTSPIAESGPDAGAPVQASLPDAVPAGAAGPAAGAPACIAALQTNLDSLKASAGTSETVPWSFKRGEVTKLVQSALDCPDVHFKVDGSLELLELELSDLEISWNEAALALTLRTVATDAEASDASSDGTGPGAQTFVLR